MAHLALAHELGHRADRLLDRHVWIDPVLVVEIDVVEPSRRSEPSQALRTYSGRPSTPRASASSGVAHDAELGREDDLVAAAASARPTQLLVDAASRRRRRCRGA